MRSSRLFSTVLVLSFLVACSMPWEEQETEHQPPAPPTITGHELQSHRAADNDTVSINILYELNGNDFAELHRSAPNDGGPDFQHLVNRDDSPGEYLDDGSRLAHPCWGERYVYRMRVYSDAGESVWSDDYVIDTPPFLPPENVSAAFNADDNTVTITWDAVVIDDVQFSYKIYRAEYTEDPSELVYHSFDYVVDEVSTTSYTDSDVSPGTRYAYRVTTLCNVWGQTPQSTVAVLGSSGGGSTAVPAPRGLTAQETAERDGINVSWQAVTGADGYKVYRAIGGSDASYVAVSDWLDDGLPSSGAVSYTDSTAIYGTTYYYRVTARANAIESEQSAYVQGNLGSVGAAPPAPGNVTARQHYQGGWIEVRWDAVSGVARYRVYRLESSATADPADLAAYEQVHETTDASMVQWDDYREDDSHDVGRLYYYRVETVTEHGESVSDDYGEGFFGAELAKPDGRPENGGASAGAYSDAIVVTWDAVPDAALYRVYSRGGTANYIEATEEFAVSDWITGTRFVHMTGGDGNGEAYYKIQPKHAWGGVSSLSDGFMGTVDPAGPAYTAGDADDGGGGDTSGSGSWTTLGVDGFASSSDELVAATVGSTLYVGFADGADPTNRIKVMYHDGSETGSWSPAGDYLSLSATFWDEVSLTEIDGALYAAYADTDDSVTSGGSSRIFVKKLSGPTWSDLGSPGYGTHPELTGNGTTLSTVFTSTSVSLLSSLTYPGTGTTWNGYDNDYWFENTVSSSTIALDRDETNKPVVAVVSGDTSITFYRNDGGWASHFSTFTPSTGSYDLELYGFRIDGGGTPYLAYSNRYDTAEQASCDVAQWNGSAWQELDLLAQIGTIDGSVSDLSIIPAASGSGVVVAAGYRDGTALRVELWHYDGSAWQQIGPDISVATSANYPSLSVAVQYDGSGRPVVVFVDDESKEIRARGYRE